MIATVLKPNPLLWNDLEKMSVEEILRNKSLKSLIRTYGIPMEMKAKV